MNNRENSELSAYHTQTFNSHETANYYLMLIQNGEQSKLYWMNKQFIWSIQCQNVNIYVSKTLSQQSTILYDERNSYKCFSKLLKHIFPSAVHAVTSMCWHSTPSKFIMLPSFIFLYLEYRKTCKEHKTRASFSSAILPPPPPPPPKYFTSLNWPI